VGTKQPILIISGKNPIENPGGLGSYSLSIAKSIKNAGYDVKILCFGPINKSIKVFDNVEIVQMKVKLGFLFSAGSIPINAQLSKQIVKYLKSNPMGDPAAIIGAGIWFYSAISVKKRLNLKSRVVAAYFTTYSHEFKGHLKGTSFQIFGPLAYLQSLMLYLAALLIFSPYEKRGLRNCDSILAHYLSTKDLLISELPELEEKIRIARMPNLYMSKLGPSFETDKSRITNEVSLNFLLVNRLDPRKGIGLFLHAYQKLLLSNPHKKFHFDIVGSGHFRAQYESLARKLSLTESVQFHGYLADPYSLVTSRTVYVLAALEEGSSSISLIESMSKKLPSIVSNIDGMKEDIRDGKDGFLYNPYDQDSFVKAAHNYLNKPSLLREHGEEAFLRFKLKFPEVLTPREVESILK
jgi:glycosyltransferase involved in cell wall biosynthesis